MAGILDKIKGMFAGAKDKATETGGHDTSKDKVGDANHQADAAQPSGTKVDGTAPGDSDSR